MNPNEIKKGLKEYLDFISECYERYKRAWSNETDKPTEDGIASITNALAYINQLEAEVEKYKADKAEYIKDYKGLENSLKYSEQERKFEQQRVVHLQTKIERLKKEVDEGNRAYSDLADCFSKECDEVSNLTLRLKNANEYEVFLTQKQKTVKSEAIKEFAELTIKDICEQVNAPTPSESYIVEKCNQVIVNRLKEMVGDE